MRNGDITVRLNRWDEHCRSLLVCGKFPGRKHEVEIHVMQSISIRSLKPEPPRINWPSIGQVDEEGAKLFSHMMRRAAQVARHMAKCERWGRPLGKGWRVGMSAVPRYRSTGWELVKLDLQK